MRDRPLLSGLILGLTIAFGLYVAIAPIIPLLACKAAGDVVMPCEDPEIQRVQQGMMDGTLSEW